MKKEKLLCFGTLITIFIILFIIITYTPIINKYRNDGKLIINEIMANNKSTIFDSNGDSHDYIEIYNGYDHDINLEGYYLSDNYLNTKKWRFPNITIKSNDYLLVYASDGNDNDSILHTNFKLKEDGEVITLSDTEGKSLSKVYYLKTTCDTSYGFNGNKYVYYYNGTPNKQNSGLFSEKPISTNKKETKLHITEYINNNISSFKSKDNNYYNMIELYNDYDYDINLKGYYLSNKYDSPYKYIFPDVTIKSKEYLPIYASGLNKYDGEIHTNFVLNSNDNILVLSDNLKNELEKIYINNNIKNISVGYYNNAWKYYKENSIGKENNDNYIENNNFEKDIIINEVNIFPTEAIEIKNISTHDVNLSTYKISDKGNNIVNLPNITLKPNSFYVVYGSDYYSYNNGKLYTGFHLNNNKETLYLYNNDIIVDSFEVGKLINNVSSGLNSDNKRVYYKDITLGKENSNTSYSCYTDTPLYSLNNSYIDKDATLELKTNDDSQIYYTLDGTFPNKSSKKYIDGIKINNDTVVKAIAYKDDCIESDIISKTYLTTRKHDLPVISISTSDNDLFGYNGLLSNYYSDIEKKVSFEYYEKDGKLGTSAIAGIKLTGMDSRKRDQKSMAIYLRKEYGKSQLTYPFFKDGETLTYSSFTLRNAGEDPFGIRIQDTVLTYALKDKMDIDMQDYRSVVVYLNGQYYGLYNLREKLNGDYIESKYNLKKDNFDLIKYNTPVVGNNDSYNNIVNYILHNDPINSDVYEYLKNEIDMQELCNYLIVESYYGNTDLGNIRYWKPNNGKLRWMLYDLDWSLWNTNLDIGYPVINKKVPAVTYLNSIYTISRRLYRNEEFKDLYLRTLAYHLKNTFYPERMNKIVDELKTEINNEMPHHIKRWNSMYPSMQTWENNINSFKNKLNNRYNNVLNRLQNDLNLSYNEYIEYFGDLT